MINVNLSASKAWLMYKNDNESVEIVTVALSQNNASLIYLEENHLNMQEKEKLAAKRNNSAHDDEEDEEEDELFNIDCTKTDIKERYLKLIFKPYKFSRTNIFKALGVSLFFNEFQC